MEIDQIDVEETFQIVNCLRKNSPQTVIRKISYSES